MFVQGYNHGSGGASTPEGSRMSRKQTLQHSSHQKTMLAFVSVGADNLDRHLLIFAELRLFPLNLHLRVRLLSNLIYMLLRHMCFDLQIQKPD